MNTLCLQEFPMFAWVDTVKWDVDVMRAPNFRRVERRVVPPRAVALTANGLIGIVQRSMALVQLFWGG